jgi:hypothetical protein
MVGGALDHLIFDKADAIRFKNIEAALVAVKRQIESSEQETIDKEWFKSEEALAAFKMLSDKISYEPDPQKVEAIGRVVSACGNKKHSEDPNKLSVVEHLSRLSATQIKLLSIISEVEPKDRWIDGGGDFQERCHSLAAFQAACINGSAGLDWRPSGGLLIHTTTGWRQQRVDWLQRFGWAWRAFS